MARKILYWSIFFSTTVYFIIGVKGSYLFGMNSKVLIIDNFPLSVELQLFKFIFLITTICNIPYQIFPCKETLDQTFLLFFGSITYKCQPEEPNFQGFLRFIISKARLKLITLILLLTTYLTSLCSIDLAYSLSVVGTLNVCIVCILPGLFYLSLGDDIVLRVFSLFLVCFGMILFSLLE